MKITRRKLGQIIRKTLLEAPRSSMPTAPGARDREVMLGYPGEIFDWNSCINKIYFEPWFDEPEWSEESHLSGVKPSDLVVHAGDGSSASLDGDGLADQSVFVAGSGYAPEPRCWIKRSGDKITMGWSYIPEYSYREFKSDFLPSGESTVDSEFDKYPVLNRWSVVLTVASDADGEYILDYIQYVGDQGSSHWEGSLWQDDDCEDDCCLSTICDDVRWGSGYTKYSGCEACAEEADDCPGELPDGMIDREILRR